MSASIRLPHRGNAYQPRVQPWESVGGYGSVLKERRIGRTWRRDAAACGSFRTRKSAAGIPRALAWVEPRQAWEIFVCVHHPALQAGL
jgi:hypothetical protein